MKYLNTPGGHYSAGTERPPLSLRQALESVATEARASGLAERTVSGAYEAPARAVMRYLGGNQALASIGFEEIRAMVRRCLAENLTACTVRRNYLRVLRLAFRSHGWADDENPVHAVLRNMRAALRVSRPPITYFEPEELHDVLRRVAEYRAPSGRRLRRQPRDLAVFRIVAFRGIRCYELERVRIERDVDVRGGTLRIESKCVTVPRTVRLSPALRDDLITLVAARTHGALIEGGARTLNSICEVWKRRLDEPRLNLRNLRRSMATALDDAGAGLAGIANALGHVPGSPHTNRYVGEVRRRTAEAFTRIERDHPRPPVAGASPPQASESS